MQVQELVLGLVQLELEQVQEPELAQELVQQLEQLAQQAPEE